MTDRLNPGDMVDARYRIVSRLGSGGMADVYCAEDLQLGRKVALKMLYRRFAEDSEFVERFRREASSAAGLQHPNVVAVYDRGEQAGTQYIAMEYVEGRSLKEIVRAEGALPPERAIDLTSQILRAARFAHKRGIIHRDLKPHNVIVDADDRAKVTDFGIARAGSSEMTQTGSIMGTAQYVSPEQAQGHAVSARSDLYSVGIVLYELLTGRVPFDGESAVAVALQQVGAAPIPPSQLNPTVAPELERIVLKALEKDPAKRQADADEFLKELEHARTALDAGDTTGATRVLAASPVVHRVAPAPVEFATTGYEAVAYVDPVHAPPPIQDEAGADRRWWIALLAALVVAAVIVGALLISSTPKVTVPLVVGDAETVAKVTLTDKGFSVLSRQQTSPQPKGQVIRQEPLAGAKVPKNSKVTVIVSGGPGQAVVPELGGMGRAAARKALVALGFQVIERTQADPEVVKNHVISTQPASGGSADKGSTVTLVVSSGPELVAVPALIGKSQDDAEAALTSAGLTAKVAEQESADKDPGTVLSQDQAADKKVAKGSAVTITVAKAVTEVDVPSVIGKTQDEAVATLSGEGFKVVTTQTQVDSASQDQLVLTQDPASGKLKKGKTVNIAVGRLGGGDTSGGDGTTSTSDSTTTTPAQGGQ